MGQYEGSKAMTDTPGFDQFLAQQGIDDPAMQAELKAKITGYAIEVALSNLAKDGKLSPTETEEAKAMLDSGKLDAQVLEKLLGTPERQQVLARAFAEAFEIVATTK